jgi:hypothetical protein
MTTYEDALALIDGVVAQPSVAPTPAKPCEVVLATEREPATPAKAR